MNVNQNRFAVLPRLFGMRFLFDFLIFSIGTMVFLCPGHSAAQGNINALTTGTSGLVLGYCMNGVGWSFVPTSDLLVTAISSTAPQVNFWQGPNQVIATYSYSGPFGSDIPSRSGRPPPFQSVSSLYLSAGQTYFISTQNLIPDPTVTFYAFERNGEAPPFSTSPYITQFASYYLSTEGQWSSTTFPLSENGNLLFLGPNFQFQVVPEPTPILLLLLAGCGCCLRGRIGQKRKVFSQPE